MNPLLRDELASILAEAPLPQPMPLDIQSQPLDISPRAKKMRSILRIADGHNWHSAITHFLESRNAEYLSDLSDPQLDDLKERMDGYVDAASMGCSLADCLPAS